MTPHLVMNCGFLCFEERISGTVYLIQLEAVSKFVWGVQARRAIFEERSLHASLRLHRPAPEKVA